MKSRFLYALTLLNCLLGFISSAFAQGTAFTYQGRLQSGTNFANGTYDLTFALYSVSSGAGQLGNTITNSPVVLTNGLFNVALDFGNQFPGANRWLEIGVRTNGSGTFSTLSPRQQITATPYAITASNLSGVLPASQLTGTIPSTALGGAYSGAMTLSNTANSFSGDGSGLTGVNAATLNGLAATNFWKTTGNSGTTSTSNFLGTTDNQPLEIKVNGLRVMRYENSGASSFAIALGFSSSNGAPNVIAGSPMNFVKPGVVGAAIGGGGATNYGGPSAINSVAADFGTIGGGFQNQIQTTNARTATIAGGDNNIASGAGSFIGGGGWDGAFIGGNTNAGNAAVISGGFGNQVQSGANYSMIGGGNHNQIKTFTTYATIGGGNINAINSGASYSTIGGGTASMIDSSAAYSTIGGGISNHIFTGADTSTISGGGANTIQNNSSDATIGGGEDNGIGINSSHSTIGGGQQNIILTDTSSSTIGGGSNNQIQTNADFSTIGGGNFNVIQGNMFGSTIGGGMGNQVQTNAFLSTIGGGNGNQIQIGAGTSTIGGGSGNKIQTAAGASSSTIGGGSGNQIQSFANSSTIGGGVGNQIQPGTRFSTIGGGSSNTVSAGFGFIGGGTNNVIQTNALASAIVGGWINKVQTNAAFSVIGGGRSNVVTGTFGIIPGGDLNLASTNSFAAGHRAKAVDQGAFVWADATDADFSDAGTNTFNVRASGGVRFFSDSSLASGVSLAPGGTSWAVISDRNAKKNFQPVDSEQVLKKLAAIPISHWNYKWEADDAVPHLGPMAQDFKHAFYPGRDDKVITTLEADGVALAAIQGLNQKLEQKETEITELKQRLDKLEQLLNSKTGAAK